MTPRLGRVATAVALQLAALVLAHQLVYLARYGSRFGEALAHAGHGDAWRAAVVTSLVLAAGLAAVGIARLIHLAGLVRRTGSGAHVQAAGIRRALLPMALVRRLAQLAPKIVVLQLVLLTTQENIERGAIGQAMPGPGILLSPEYAGGAWIAIAVALAVSLVAALFEWRHGVLLARLRAARAPLPRRASSVPRPVERDRSPVVALLGRASALRAPPAIAAA
jgi:hypothetical protein